MSIITILFIAFSISIDVFYISYLYGSMTLPMERKYFSLLVAVFHFTLPILGGVVGLFIYSYLSIDYRLIKTIVFFFLGISMLLSFFKNNSMIGVPMYQKILLSFVISIDSLTLGIGFSFFESHYFLMLLLFFIVSFMVSYLGVWMGSAFSFFSHKIAVLMGGLFFIFLSVLSWFYM